MKIDKLLLFLSLFFTLTANIYSKGEGELIKEKTQQTEPKKQEIQSEAEFLKDPNIITVEEVRKETTPPSVIDKNHEKPKNPLDMELINATIAKDLSIIKSALSKGANINAAPNQGVTALHLAATGGVLDIVKYLVENGANINAKDDDGYSPLVYALSGQNEDIVNYLKSKGATE
jgi:ankyrin repeat protein